MKKLGRCLLSALLALCILVSCPVPAAFAQGGNTPAAMPDSPAVRQADISWEDTSALSLEDVAYYDTLEQAAADVRAQLLAGNASVSVGVNLAYDDTLGKTLYQLAVAHTGDPDEGDYLANHCRGYSANISIKSSSFVITYFPNHATTAQQEAEVDAKVAQILASVRRDTPYHTVLDIYRWLRSNVIYPEDLSAVTTIEHTAYGALIQGESVCEGYAAAFYRLALACGIDCRIVDGYLIDGAHAWNIVELDGLYYIIDATNDIFLRCPASVEGLLVLEEAFASEPFVSEYPMATQDYIADISYVYDADTATLILPDTDSVTDYYRDVADLLMEQRLGGITNPDFKYSTAPWESLMDQVKTVKLGGSPSFIPSRMFYWNQNIESVTVPASVTHIQSNAFNSCTSLWDIYFTGTQAQWDAITVGTYNNALNWVTVHTDSEGVTSGSFRAAGGWQEALYAEIDGIADSDVTAVLYSGPVSGQLTGQDLQYLVRSGDSGVRIDIPGLKSGSYTLTVIAGNVVYTQDNITVSAFDRSGYAHWNYTQGVGAYYDDGTIKENAVILYVTDENKDTVSVTAGGITVTGIGNILNTGGKSSKNGGLANTNGDILKKLADEGRPLVVRIVGRVTQPEGVTAWGSYDYGGNPDDNGGMCYMKSCANITIEGIGNDATVDGWGFAVGCSDGDYAAGYSRNFEFRNLTFKNVPEDCIGISGRGGSTLTDPIEHAWVHNCAFFGPSGLPDASDDQDKAEGDGAVDFKWGQYYTMSYCYFESYHKTHLIGGSDTNLQYNVTWHHNYYKNCESRGPLGRQANMHVYNNVYEGQSSYVMSLRANCYIFSEYNTFINCKNVSNNSGGGVCKSYMNDFQSCTGTDASDIVIVTDKSQAVSSGNKYAGFELSSSLGYVADGDYLLDTDTAVAKENALNNAGPMDFRANYGSSGGSDDSGDSGNDDAQVPDITEGSYIHNFTENALSSSFYTFTSCNLSAKGDVSFNGLTLSKCLKLEADTLVTFTAPTAGTLTLVFHETGINGAVTNQQTVNIDGQLVQVSQNNIVVAELEAGSHTIQRGSVQIYLYYMVFTPDADAELPHSHSYDSAVTTVPGCTDTGVRTYTCSGCGDSYTETIPALGHGYSQSVIAPTCTAQGYTLYSCSGCGDEYADSFVAAAGHSYADGVCSVCGDADPDYKPGVSVAGSFVSFGNAEDAFTVSLFVDGSEEAAYIFTNVLDDEPANSGTWSIDGVAAGEYTVKVTKNNHVAREYTLTVDGDAVTLDVTVCLAGDVNGDGLVNFSDYSQVLSQSKNPASEILVGYAFACGDVNGDGMINFSDYSQVLSQAKGKHSLW